jgi:hypothetical protein
VRITYQRRVVKTDKHLISLLVQQARNVPLHKTTFGRKREYFVTIAYQATTNKSETKRTKGAQIEGQTVVWDQKLDAWWDFPIFDPYFRLKFLISFVQPSSHIILCLYAKRLRQRDLLIGADQITIPVESEGASGSSIHSRSFH